MNLNRNIFSSRDEDYPLRIKFKTQRINTIHFLLISTLRVEIRTTEGEKNGLLLVLGEGAKFRIYTVKKPQTTSVIKQLPNGYQEEKKVPSIKIHELKPVTMMFSG